MTAKQTTTTAATATQNGHSPCGCQEHHGPGACCCNLICFDRPNYFCGHLLTDTDLTLQQKYVIEKNKLYHRTIDGYGVVCGLKLTCDCDCKGNILIHDGFAIDDCGNDLVVCETTRFDIIAALRSKNLLVYDLPEDDCEPRRHESRCHIKQCFYITICYLETESDYETPFQSSCTAGPKQCMPTRTHETVRFDVTDKLPREHSYLEDLEERIRHCFEVQCNSPVGVIMKKHAPELLEIFGEGEIQRRERQYDPCELFCTLRAYFLNHLKTNPDQFNCNLMEQVQCLTCPREWREDREERRRERREPELREEEYRALHREEVRDAFRKLLYYIQRYQYDCVYGDLIFSCQQPCPANCLVLGTVEVLNGKLVRVCNTPRRYLWAPANLLQVLIYSIMTGSHVGSEDRDGKTVPCCPDYDKFEPSLFLRELELNECGRYYAAKSTIDSLKAAYRSIHHSHEFTDSMAISPEIFAHVPPDQLQAMAERFGIGSSLVDRKPATLSNPNLHQALQKYTLLRRNDSIVAYTSEGKTHEVLPDFLADLSPDRSVGRDIEKVIHGKQSEAERFTRELKELKAEVDALKKKLGEAEEPKKPGRKGGSTEKEG